jgi:hypothetical protein
MPFLLLHLKFLHSADSKSYNEQVPPNIYKVKLVFHHLIQKFSDSYTAEDQVLTDESLSLWKG